jgi:glycosyltransferase involved in cell wall biosynthesis
LAHSFSTLNKGEKQYLKTTKMSYSISVIIPNYNGKHLLEENIPYVFSALETSKISDFEIIISDDHSADDSVAFIKKTYR